MVRSKPSVRYREWLETDGLGGFASGTDTGIRSRRYHALLCAATLPPSGRMVLVSGFDAWLDGVPLTSQRYRPGVTFPDGASRIASFTPEPWPTWTYPGVTQEILAVHGAPAVVVLWRGRGALSVRPFLAGRDFHGLCHENPAFRFAPEIAGDRIRFRPYDGVPGVLFAASGTYRHEPDWFRGFLYEEERARGLDHLEDLASPGTLHFDLDGEAAWIIAMDGVSLGADDALTAARRLRDAEARRRAAFPSRLRRAADQYLVRRGRGHTIIAGYPWFGDWGRDTFISVRGLCDDERRRDILVEWASSLHEGLLPNRFPDRGEAPEYNSVDAALWYVVAAAELRPRPAPVAAAIQAIVDSYARGTLHGIRMDADGLIRAGEPGRQLTWMDAKLGDWVVTPRIGKPVEVQALWLRALLAAGRHDLYARAAASLAERFWNAERGCLHDVVDADHVAGRVDSALRPNQIFAAPFLPPDRARRVVEVVERELVTPMGLRTLARGEPGYRPRYEGGPRERDAAYHQGTVWPWLIGPFCDAWVAAGGDPAEARDRFVAPLLARAGPHVTEIADGEPPHEPRGCPFQAWSLGEVLRTMGP
jgi:predicted glycogen debranching enzyme